MVRPCEDGAFEVGVEFDYIGQEYQELLLHYINHRRPNRPI
jgi:hypothetical protein